jgi:glycosyltransferase involved in cell wall biosynthesis
MKKKVLIIVENLPVPFDGRVWKEACSLRKAGYKVTVLSPRGKGYEQGYEYLEGIHIYRHPMAMEGNSPLGYVWEYGCALFWEFLYSWWIYLRRGFHIIQGCNPPDDIFLVAVPFKLLGVKYIFDHHDTNPELYLSKFERRGFFYKTQVWLEKLTFHFSDVVMSTNNSYKDIAVRRGGLASEDVFVVRNGPDLEVFKPAPSKPDLKYGKRYLIGYVGTMSTQEGLDILLDVADYIKRVGRTDVHFTCVGGGPGLATLRQMVEDKNLADSVNFTGRISQTELLDVLSTADVCVNPDKPCEMNDISTMIKIMEYMALAKPIVQFDLKEGRFSAQEASLYSSNHNQVADFADNILWLLDHPEERKRMGEFGRQRVEKELAWEHSVENLIAAYAKAEKGGKRELGRLSVKPESEISPKSSTLVVLKQLDKESSKRVRRS